MTHFASIGLVGIIRESFDDVTDATVKTHAERSLDALRAIGVSTFIPVAVPEFTTGASAINVEFYARPFGEMELLALAKAYQDAAGSHLKRPTSLDT